MSLRKKQTGFLCKLICLPGPLALFIAPYLVRFAFKRSLILFCGTRKFVATDDT